MSTFYVINFNSKYFILFYNTKILIKYKNKLFIGNNLKWHVSPPSNSSSIITNNIFLQINIYQNKLVTLLDKVTQNIKTLLCPSDYDKIESPCGFCSNYAINFVRVKCI